MRIYIPYLLLLPFLFLAGESGRMTGESIIYVIMPYNAYHFIPTILLWYIAYYWLTKLDQNGRVKYKKSVLILMLVIILYYLFAFDRKNGYIFEHFTFLETVSYIVTMLLGGMTKKGERLSNTKISIVIVVVSFILYMYQSIVGFHYNLKIITLFIGMIFAYGLGCFFLSLSERLPNIKVVERISNITLECYLTQFVVISAFKAIGFPTNVVYCFISIIGISCCLHNTSTYVVDFILKMTKTKKRIIQ